MTPTQPGDLLTAPQVAEILGVEVQTLWQWRHRGRGPESFKLARELRYRRENVERWLAEQEAATKASACDPAA